MISKENFICDYCEEEKEFINFFYDSHKQIDGYDIDKEEELKFMCTDCAPEPKIKISVSMPIEKISYQKINHSLLF